MTTKTINLRGEVHNILEHEEEFYRHTGRIFIKRMFLEKAGHVGIGHSHKHDHISCLAYGSVLVWRGKNERPITYRAPSFIDVPAGEHHQFKALEDGTTLYCIHDTHGLDVEDLGEPFVA